MTKEKLNGSAASLALAIQALFEESRFVFTNDLEKFRGDMRAAIGDLHQDMTHNNKRLNKQIDNLYNEVKSVKNNIDNINLA